MSSLFNVCIFNNPAGVNRHASLFAINSISYTMSCAAVILDSNVHTNAAYSSISYAGNYLSFNAISTMSS